MLFFDKQPAARDRLRRKDLWIYDFRTNQRFTLKERPLRRATSTISSPATAPASRQARKETERFRRFAYDELLARDKAQPRYLLAQGRRLEDPDRLPPPDEIAAEIIENLEAALDRFRRRRRQTGRELNNLA